MTSFVSPINQRAQTCKRKANCLESNGQSSFSLVALSSSKIKRSILFDSQIFCEFDFVRLPNLKVDFELVQ